MLLLFGTISSRIGVLQQLVVDRALIVGVKLLMRKLLRARDLMMLGASLLGDSILDFVSAGMESRRRRDFYPLLFGPSRPSTFTRSLDRLLTAGQIERVMKKGQPYLRLTSIGRESFYRDFPLFRFQGKRWDGCWLVVNYDIPERRRSTRKYFSRWLKSLGFGRWQRSAYISPHDFGEEIREWVRTKDLEDFVSVSKSRELAGDNKALASKVFDLEELEEEYFGVLDGLEKIKSGSHGKGIEKLRNLYFQILLTDPLLPKELLPNDWIEFKLRGRLFHS